MATPSTMAIKRATPTMMKTVTLTTKKATEAMMTRLIADTLLMITYVMTEPGIISDKWRSSQTRMTSDAQSKVYDTRRKTPGGIDHIVLTEQRIQRVRTPSIVKRNLNILRNSRRVRRVEPERPVLPRDDTGVATREVL